MDMLENAKETWSKTESLNEKQMNEMDLSKIISSRVRKEKKVLSEYFWASYIWQFLVYIAMTRLIVYFWDDWNAVLLCMGGIGVYIPFTILFIKKFKSMMLRSDGSASSILANLKTQCQQVTEFFIFKKRFDWLSIPFTCFLLTEIIFKLWVTGGWKNHLAGGITTFILILAVFITATVIENDKRFKTPLLKLQSVIRDMEEEF
jgi:hypothetical protein